MEFFTVFKMCRHRVNAVLVSSSLNQNKIKKFCQAEENLSFVPDDSSSISSEERANKTHLCVSLVYPNPTPLISFDAVKGPLSHRVICRKAATLSMAAITNGLKIKLCLIEKYGSTLQCFN